MAAQGSPRTASVAPFPPPEDDFRLARTLAADDPLRLRLEAACERLEAVAAAIIDELDLVVPDPDLEPTLGAPEAANRVRDGGQGLDLVRYLSSLDDEREIDDDDREPSLGSLGRMDQRYWPGGGTTDAEAEHDGREPQCEDEGVQEGY